MTEQEIINILKENKDKGIAYLFLPEEVWNWIEENFNDQKLMYLKPNGRWEFFSETDFDDYDNVIFALPDDYEVKREPKGEWVEFEIDDLIFSYFPNRKEDARSAYFWFEYDSFLKDSLNWQRGFTAFGGWQYEDSKRWYLAPAVKLQDGKMWNSYIIEESGEATPVIPVKIRFWKENK